MIWQASTGQVTLDQLDRGKRSDKLAIGSDLVTIGNLIVCLVVGFQRADLLLRFADQVHGCVLNLKC